MATKINVRSPFYLKVSQANIATATLNLYIYTGTFVANASVANPKYTITKDVLTSGFIVFEVAELVRDYLEIEFDGTYITEMTEGQLGSLYENTDPNLNLDKMPF